MRFLLVLAAAILLLPESSLAASFDMVNPLAAPADGNNFLFIDDTQPPGDNTFVSRNTGVPIVVGNTYRLTAATGHASGEPLAAQSIQLWTAAPGGTANLDFIGQTASVFPTWVDPLEGQWVDNFIEVTINDLALNGLHLLALVTNFSADGGGAIAYWDNFRLTENGVLMFQDGFEGVALPPGGEVEVDEAGIDWFLGNSSYANSGVAAGMEVIPEPSLALLLGLGLTALGARRRPRS